MFQTHIKYCIVIRAFNTLGILKFMVIKNNNCVEGPNHYTIQNNTLDCLHVRAYQVATCVRLFYIWIKMENVTMKYAFVCAAGKIEEGNYILSLSLE
jgi:hypothetical protein